MLNVEVVKWEGKKGCVKRYVERAILSIYHRGGDRMPSLCRVGISRKGQYGDYQGRGYVK